jgi:hypothetical protein
MRNTGKLKSSKQLSSSSSLGGGDPLVPHKSLSAKKRLKARSVKMQKLYEEERIPFVIDFLERHPWCVFMLWTMPTTIEESPHLGTVTRNAGRCTKRAVDVHEILPRGRGGNIVPLDGQDEDKQFLGLCREHHSYITTHPAFAKAKGYSR